MAVSRIPAGETNVFSAWDAPEVKEGQIVHVEKLKERGPRGELVNVNKNEVIYNSITAAQLEEISNQAYEDLYQQAHQEGLKAGHAEGYQAGLDAGKQAVDQQVLELNGTVKNLLSFLGEQDDEVEQALVNLATCIASSVVRRELTIDASHMRQVVSEALAALPMDANNITIHLNENDHQLLSVHPDTPDSWQLQIDRTLQPGGCRLNSQHSVVDFTLEDQFQQTVNSIVEKRFAELALKAKERADSNPPTDEA